MPVSDLGSDVGTASVNASAKMAELFLKLLEKLWDSTIGKSASEKAAEARLKEAKQEKADKQFAAKLDERSGEVSLRALRRAERAGEPLTVFTLHNLTENDGKRIADLCKREGVVFNGAYRTNDDGTWDYALTCRSKDLEKFKGIAERINQEIRIDEINGRIKDIWDTAEANGRPLNEQERATVAELQKQREEIQRGVCTRFNEEQANEIFMGSMNDRKIECDSLDEALNRITGRHLDKDVMTIVADSKDPSKFIRCHGTMDKYNGEEYIKTNYEVFANGKKVLETHDGRFDGRPQGYWGQQKADIAAAAGFTEGTTFLKFYSEAEYQRWAELVTRQNEAELKNLQPGANRTAADYDKAVSELHQQLTNNGVELSEDGTLLHTVDGNKVPVPNTYSQEWVNLSEEDKSRLSECAVISQQIKTLTELKAAEAALTEAKGYAMILDENTPKEQRAVIESQLTEAESKVKELKGREQELYGRRQNINAVQSVQDVDRERESGRDIGTTGRQERLDEAPGRADERLTMEEAQTLVDERMTKSKEGAEEQAKGQPSQVKGQEVKAKHTHDRE